MPPDSTACGNRIGEIAAHHEPRGLAVQCNQVRFSQHLGQAVVSQGIDEQGEMTRVEDAEELAALR